MIFAHLVPTTLPYLTAGVLLFGLWRRCRHWRQAAARPAPLFPGASSPLRAWGRLGGQLCLLRGRRTAPGAGALPAWGLHVALALLFIGHLRAVTDFPRLWAALALTPEAVARLADLAGGLVGLAALAAVLALLARRLFTPGLRAISGPEDFLVPLLLAAVIGSGLAMRFGGQARLEPVWAYFADLAALRPRPMPAVPGFAAHFLLAQALAVVLPWTKLVHAVGVFPAKAGLDPVPPAIQCRVP